MVTVKSTSDVELTTADEIISYLRAQTAPQQFAPGDAVRLTNRNGIPTNIFAGDVGVITGYSDAGSPFSQVRHLTYAGLVSSTLVPTTNLEIYKPEN